MPSGGNASNLAGMGGVFNPFNLGLYTYAHHNPVRYGDPDGKETVGELIEAKAMEAAQGGNSAGTYGWAFAATAWGALGSESVSKIADGNKITGGVLLGAALETVTLGKGKAVAEGVEFTGKTASTLGKALVESGELRPIIDGVGSQAHHIVAKAAEGASFARGKLEKFGVDIHSAANGIWVDAKEHASMHTGDYYNKIDSFFKGVNTKAQAEQAMKDAKDWVKSIVE